MKEKKPRVSEADVERLLELYSILSMTPEGAEQDMRDVIAQGIMTEAELEAAADATLARVQARLQPTVAKCLARSLAEDRLQVDDMVVELGVPIETVARLFASQEPVNRETLNGVALKLASLLGIDYCRLVYRLSRGLSAVAPRVGRSDVVFRAARGAIDMTPKKEGDSK